MYKINKKFIRNFFFIATPIILQQFLTSSVQLIDNLMVGRLGESAISGVSSVNQISFVGMLIIFGITSGAGIYTAQYFGAKEFEKLKQSYRLKIVSSIIISLVLLIVFMLFKSQLIALFLDRTSEAFALANEYMQIVMFSVIPLSINAAIGSTFREIAKPVYPTIAGIISIIINTVLNYCLIFGNFGFPELGVYGAGLATVIARTLEMILILIFVKLYGQEFSTKMRRLFIINKQIISKILEKALPLTLNEALWSLGMTTLFFAYSRRGEIALAGHTVANTIFQLAFVLFGGLGVATNVMVGNELGANNLEKAKYNSVNLIKLGVAIGIIISITVFSASGLIISIYDLSEYGEKVARYNTAIIAVFFPLYIVTVCIFFALRAGGDVKSTLFMDAFFMWIIPVPFALYLAFFTELPIYTMFLLVQSTEILKTVVAIKSFRKGNWLNNLAID